MRRLLIVLLLPVVAQFGIHYFRVFAEAVGEASVDQWEEDLNAQVEKEFPRG